MADFESVPINGTAEQLEKLLNMDISESISEDSGNNEIPTAAAVFDFLSGQSAGGSVSYLPQNLEDGQKAQARENIGAATIDNTKVGADAWSSKNTVDKLCPTFLESGTIVTCEPVEGYPLEVTAEEGATITRCGKNLIPKVEPKTGTHNGVTFTLNADDSVTVSGIPTANASFTLWSYFSATHLAGKQVSITNTVDSPVYMYVHLHLADGTDIWTWLNGHLANKLTGVVPDNIATMSVGVVALTGFDGNPMTFYPQLELGSTPTAFEPCKSETFAIGENVPALPGVNTLWADKGIITVTGKANPSAIINKLTNAILSLGGNV